MRRIIKVLKVHGIWVFWQLSWGKSSWNLARKPGSKDFWHNTITGLMSHTWSWTCSSKLWIYSSTLFNSVSLLHLWTRKWTSRIQKGKDHSPSRKETSEERKLERSEAGALKESEIGCDMTQNQQFNPVLPEKVLYLGRICILHAHAPVNHLISGSSDKLLPPCLLSGEGGKEEGTHQPQS